MGLDMEPETSRTSSRLVRARSWPGGPRLDLNSLRRCYRQALREDPTQRGSLRATIRVGPNGEVASAVVTTTAACRGRTGVVVVWCCATAVNVPPISASVATSPRVTRLTLDAECETVFDDLQQLVRCLMRVKERAPDHLGALDLAADLGVLSGARGGLEGDARAGRR